MWDEASPAGGVAGATTIERRAMWRTGSLLVFGALAMAVAACGDLADQSSTTKGAQPAAAPAPGTGTPSAVPAPPPGARTIDEAERTAMKDALATETGSTKRLWLYSQPGNPEVAALVATIEVVFRDAGWQVSAETATGISLKPGIMALIAEEQYAPYIDTAMKALEASGLGVKSASGYRAYYEEKKRENPSWPGVPMKPDQDFVVVLGPKAAS